MENEPQHTTSIFDGGEDEAASSVKVCIRVRPMNEREKSANALNCVAISSTTNISVNVTEDTAERHSQLSNSDFAFDRVYDDATAQQTVFETAAAPVVDSVLNGYNGSIIAYGQTGTGKTHTIEGDLNGDERGIIPRCVRRIFDHIQEDSNSPCKYLVRVSYLQIYNEKISDLLDSASGDNLKIREGASGVYVESLTEPVARKADDVYTKLRLGKQQRRTNSTRMNRVSSRSHAVFTVIVEKSEETEHGPLVTVGKLHLVDLAGSERFESTSNEQHQKETANINQSLTVFGKVVRALTSKGTSHIPYRDSKLTRILQDSLGGNCRTTIISTVSPASASFLETVATLKFAQRAKKVKNKAIKNEDKTESALLSAYEAEIRKLRAQLEQVKNNNGSGSSSSSNEHELAQLQMARQRADDEKSQIASELRQRELQAQHALEEKERLEAMIAERQVMLLAGGTRIEETEKFQEAVSKVKRKFEEERLKELEEVKKKEAALQEERRIFEEERQKWREKMREQEQAHALLAQSEQYEDDLPDETIPLSTSTSSPTPPLVPKPPARSLLRKPHRRRSSACSTSSLEQTEQLLVGDTVADRPLPLSPTPPQPPQANFQDDAVGVVTPQQRAVLQRRFSATSASSAPNGTPRSGMSSAQSIHSHHSQFGTPPTSARSVQSFHSSSTPPLSARSVGEPRHSPQPPSAPRIRQTSTENRMRLQPVSSEELQLLEQQHGETKHDGEALALMNGTPLSGEDSLETYHGRSNALAHHQQHDIGPSRKRTVVTSDPLLCSDDDDEAIPLEVSSSDEDVPAHVDKERYQQQKTQSMGHMAQFMGAQQQGGGLQQQDQKKKKKKRKKSRSRSGSSGGRNLFSALRRSGSARSRNGSAQRHQSASRRHPKSAWPSQDRGGGDDDDDAESYDVEEVLRNRVHMRMQKDSEQHAERALEEQEAALVEYARALMDEKSGISLSTKRVMLKTYLRCFSGTEAAGWFMANMQDIDSTDKAQAVGQNLLDLGVFVCVKPQHGVEFVVKDGYIYKFRVHEEEDQAMLRERPKSSFRRPFSSRKGSARSSRPDSAASMLSRTSSASLKMPTFSVPDTTMSVGNDGGDNRGFDEAPKLHLAAINGDADSVKVMLNSGAFDVSAGDDEGRTPLMYAVIANNMKVVKLLLKYKADVNLADVSGYTALLWAACYGWRDMLKLLVKHGGDLFKKDFGGRTCMHWACKSPSTDCLDYLIKAQPDLMNHQDNDSLTPLHWSVMHNRPSHTERLLRNGANLGLVDERGRTCLHYAALHGHIECICAIIKLLPQSVNVHDRQGHIPLHLAISEGDVNAFNFLVDAGPHSINAVDNHRATPLHWAAACNQAGMCRTLVQRGANVMARDGHGLTPIHHATDKGFEECVAVLQHLTPQHALSRHPSQQQQHRQHQQHQQPVQQPMASLPRRRLSAPLLSPQRQTHSSSPALARSPRSQSGEFVGQRRSLSAMTPRSPLRRHESGSGPPRLPRRGSSLSARQASSKSTGSNNNSAINNNADIR